MSHTSVRGLVGVSANSSLVLGLTAAFHCAMSVCETKVHSTPNLAISLPNRRIVVPKTDCEQITWSPLLSSPRQTIRMALMPLPVPMQASVPSSAARRFSMLLTVGLPKRAYM